MSSIDPLSLSLANKVAIITGSGKENGIGAGIALALARAGAKVVINYVSEATAPRAAEVVSRIQTAVGRTDTVLVVQADIASPEGAKELVRATLEGFGVDHIDILVNNAAAGARGSILNVKPGDMAKAFEVTTFGVVYMIQAAVPYMPRGSRIINIGTIASKLGIPGEPIYVATKAANDALTWSISQELGREKGITVNTIAPGPVLTDSMSQNIPPIKAITDRLVSMTRAEERTTNHEDVADMVLLLASEKSRWVTGQFISVSGGITGN